MDKVERIFIVIDGSNFYHRLKELHLNHLLLFDYEKLSNFLAGDRTFTSRNYYIGAIREEINNPKSRELMAAQRKLTGKLTRDGWIIKFGHMLKTDGYHEKGVDVEMAVDILSGAYENLYDTLILVSSDTDLIPALKKARTMKKNIEYIGFSHKPSHALIANSDVRRLLIKNDLEKFFQKNKKTNEQ